MCGIALIVAPLASRRLHDDTKFHDQLQRKLCQRGPDHFQRLDRTIGEADNDPWAVSMCSAVLYLRGDELVPQPLVDSSNNILSWNGEVFGMAVDTTSDEEQDEEVLLRGSDTIYLSEKLQAAGEILEKMTEEQLNEEDPVVEILRRVRGPFAVSWLHAKSNRLYFAHDRFGRRSLVYKCDGDDGDLVAKAEEDTVEFAQNDLKQFVLMCVGVKGGDDELNYQELPASGVFVLDLQARPSYRLEFHPYKPLGELVPSFLSTISTDRFGCDLPFVPDNIEDLTELISSARGLLVALSNAVGVRVRSIPSRPASTARVAVLFSGGLDSVVLAALTHFHVPVDESVDLLTVCFDENSNFASPDRRAAELAHAELCALYPKRQWRLVRINVPREELATKQHEIQALMAPCDSHMDFNIGAAFWFLSRGRGEPKVYAEAENSTLEELNAFLKPQRGDLRTLETEIASINLFADQVSNEDTILCPVHRCGHKRKPGCVLGVCKSCCFKMQRAVDKLMSFADNSGAEVVDVRELQGYRAKLLDMGVQSEAHLDDLLDLLSKKQQDKSESPFLCCRVHRSKVEQDKTAITTAEEPTRKQNSEEEMYQTSARVVLVGIGADEQLAGYGRHRTALINGGEVALRAELHKDLGRIWKRNLGRDDRCIAAHGREARFPYLDEHVVSTIATFPVASLCDADLPRGVGDKRALRVVAKTLGLRSCAGLAKRAIQFGSRIAKVSNNGSNRQTQGNNKFSSVE